MLPLITVASLAFADPGPKAANWHSEAVGPDGPWNAVEVKIRSLDNTVALFPGRRYHNYVITSDYCAYNSSISHCAAGTYSKDAAIRDQLAGIQYKPDAQDFLAGAQIMGNKTSMFMDTFDLGFDGGIIAGVTMGLFDSQMIAYPGGTWYPLFAGCLSLGANDVNQSYTQDDGQPAINDSIIPWYLSQHGSIPSSSFGMHIGSAVPSSSMKGLLLYGGYDRNRVVGDVLGIDGDFTDLVLLKDIGIRVVKGASPFGFDSKDHLLADGNSSLSSGVPVQLDACSPYLTLPKSTCDAIAANLPLNYNSSLGLYFWNTSDPKYDRIVGSASALSFTFSSGNKDLTINIPFHHLNLTLVSPLTDQPTPYFPCSTGGIGSYVLGRAFFQDAFLGANWERKTWWLAQAPGPNFQSVSNVVSILSSDTTIYSGSNDWESSWDGVWKELGPSESTGSNSTGSKSPAADSQLPVWSTGAKAGVGVGAALGVLILAALTIHLWRRKCRKAH